MKEDILCQVDGEHQNWYWSEFTIWPGQYTFATRDSQLSFHCSALYLPISKRKTQEPQYMEVHHIKDFGVLREWEKNKFNFCSSWNRCSESKADIEELSCSGWKRLWLICSCAAQKWGEKLSKHGGGAHNSQNQLVRRAVHCTNVLPLSCPAFVRVSWIRTCNDKKQNAMHKTHRIVYWLYFDLNLFWEDFFQLWFCTFLFGGLAIQIEAV